MSLFARIDRELRGYHDNDILTGGDGDDYLFGQDGNDHLVGGAGLDNLSGGRGDDLLELGPDGGSRAAGGGGLDVLLGGAGGDFLFGGSGNDIIAGGAGRDALWGQQGADTFRFAEPDFTADETQFIDRIRDFSQAEGDLIDLSAVDAINGGADDAFTFIGTAAFGHEAGELRYYTRSTATGDVTWIEADRDGDGAAEIRIKLTGEFVFDASDFVL